jgi:hypothetical protein
MLKRAREGMQVVITANDAYNGPEDRVGQVCTVVKQAIGRGTATAFGPFVYLRVNETGEYIHTSKSRLQTLAQAKKGGK